MRVAIKRQRLWIILWISRGDIVQRWQNYAQEKALILAFLLERHARRRNHFQVRGSTGFGIRAPTAPSGDARLRAGPTPSGRGDARPGSGGPQDSRRKPAGLRGSGAGGVRAPVRGPARSPTQERERGRFARIACRGSGGTQGSPSDVPAGPEVTPRATGFRRGPPQGGRGSGRGQGRLVLPGPGAVPGGGNLAGTPGRPGVSGTAKRRRVSPGDRRGSAARGQPRLAAGGDAAATGIGSARGLGGLSGRRRPARVRPFDRSSLLSLGTRGWIEGPAVRPPLACAGACGLPGRQVSFAGQKCVRSLVLARLTPLFYPKVIHTATKFWGKFALCPII